MTQSVYDKFKEWLGEDGVRFFKDVHRNHGRLAVNLRGYGMPHPVHFREGMTVRNWMRANLSPMPAVDLDNVWEGFVMEALALEGHLFKPLLLLTGKQVPVSV